MSDQSDQYELRRLKLRRICVSKDASENVNTDWPETDFYEYYWAHQMYGTTISHVAQEEILGCPSSRLVHHRRSRSERLRPGPAAVVARGVGQSQEAVRPRTTRRLETGAMVGV